MSVNSKTVAGEGGRVPGQGWSRGWTGWTSLVKKLLFVTSSWSIVAVGPGSREGVASPPSSNMCKNFLLFFAHFC